MAPKVQIPTMSSAYVSDARAGFDGIVTTQRVVIQSQNGTVEMSAPLDPRAADYDEVTIYRAVYAPDKPTFIWYRGYRMDRPQPTPELVTKFDAGNAVVARYELSPLDCVRFDAVECGAGIPVWSRDGSRGVAKPWRLREWEN